MTPIEQANAARRAAGKLLATIAAEVLPGRCMFCEEPLPPKGKAKRRVICNERECRLSYMRVYIEGYREPTRKRRVQR